MAHTKLQGQAPVHKYWEEILNDYLVPGKIDPISLIVTHRIGINDVAECYKRFDEHRDGIVKVFVETKFSSPPSYVSSRSTRRVVPSREPKRTC